MRFYLLALLPGYLAAAGTGENSRGSRSAPSSSPYPPTGNITLLHAAAQESGAVCLDGSPAAFYFLPGAEASKFLIFAEGGGWCGPGLNCLQRAGTPLGSSLSYPPTMAFQGGVLDSDPIQNPLMHNWQKIYLKYCDGSSQTSDMTSPIPVGNQTIYYRGHRILRAIQDYLIVLTPSNPAPLLASATEVVVSGCSAGGLSVYLHADEWKAALPSSVRVTALPDSGFFLNHNGTKNGGYGALMRTIVQGMNGTLPAACVAANPQDPASCIFAEVIAATLSVPTFAQQGKYDSWQMVGDADLPLNDTEGINAWGAMLSQRIGDSLLSHPQHGAFLDSCLHHCGGFDAFKVDNFTQATAHAQWYTKGGRSLFNQTESYPCTACCN